MIGYVTLTRRTETRARPACDGEDRMQKRPFAGRRLRESKTAIQNPLFPDESRFVRPEEGTGWAEHRLDPASVVASGLSHAQAAMQPD
jgi:hypothetical protein